MSYVKKATRLRKGSKVWTPRPGGAIDHSSGAKYEVDENGSTIKRIKDGPSAVDDVGNVQPLCDHVFLTAADEAQADTSRRWWSSSSVRTWRL
jgi:hypothetical protein